MFTAWRKSSYSESGSQSQCVEVGVAAGRVGVRDSKTPERGHLAVSAQTWRVFVKTLS